MRQDERIYVTAAELSELFGISTGHAYKIIRQMNQELSKKGYITIAGKVPRRYMEERCYGIERKEMVVI